MTSIEDRGRANETHFAREEELAFRITARRNRLLGQWAATEMKLTKEEADAYATALVHAAYGIEGESIVLSAALELQSLDLNELEAVLADLDMALANQVPTLREFGSKKASA